MRADYRLCSKCGHVVCSHYRHICDRADLAEYRALLAETEPTIGQRLAVGFQALEGETVMDLDLTESELDLPWEEEYVRA